eukprot:2807358-Prymnesium_polylepis.3
MFAMRANDHLRSMPGTFAQLTPLQLACKLGDHKMFQHIMRRHSAVVWKWGPITQYQVCGGAPHCATPASVCTHSTDRRPQTRRPAGRWRAPRAAHRLSLPGL